MMPGSSLATPSFRRPLAEIGLILFATFAAYAPTFRAGFIWNDDDYVTSAALRSWTGLGKIWFKLGATEQYYPVLHSAFWLEHRFWGDAPLGYHLLNAALHVTSAALLLALLRRLAVPGALLAALVFALHPVCVESVAWVSEQKNTLSTALCLAAALAYFGFVERRTAGRYALAALLFVLALFSKSVTATLPAALLVVLWWRQGSLLWRRDVAPLLPWLVLGAAFGLFSGWVERHYIGAEGAAFTLTGVERLLLASRAVWFYFGKLVWPSELIFFYPRWHISAASPAAYIYLVAALAVLAALILLARRQRAPLAGALLFAGTLFPTLGFFNVYAFIFSYVADHWQYLASLGVIVPLCAGFTCCTRGLLPAVRVAMAAALLFVLGFLTWQQAGMYRDMETFYRTTLRKNPDAWMAHNNLGVYLRENKRPGDQAEFEAALRVHPDYVPAQYNLGVCLLDAGHPAEALEHLQRASGTRHKDAVHLYLGEALAALHRDAEAETQYAIHAQLDPTSGAAWCGLGGAQVRQGKSAAAAESFARAEAAAPTDPEPAFALGDALVTLERYPAAASAYRRGLTLAPGRAYAHANLGNILLMEEQVAAAVTEFRAALHSRPNDPQLQESLQRALAVQASQTQ
jgi:Flp pilus assembly protein TadD